MANRTKEPSTVSDINFSDPANLEWKYMKTYISWYFSNDTIGMDENMTSDPSLSVPDSNDTDLIDSSYYTDNYDDLEASIMEMRAWAVLSLASLYIVIILIGLVANAAVVYIIARSRRSKAVTSIYIFNLAIADLLYVVCLSAAVYPMLNGHWALGHVMCKLYLTCDGVSKFASVMFLVVLSFDRYMAVCYPIAARSVRTAKVAFAAAGVSWLLVTASMTPVFFYATLVKVTAGGHSTLQCAIYWPTEGSHDESLNGQDENDTVSILLQNNTNGGNSNYWYGDTNETISGRAASETDSQRRIFTLYLFGLSFAVPLLTVWIFYAMILHRLWSQKRTLFNSELNAGNCVNGTKCGEHRRTKSERAMLPSNKAIQRRRRSTKRVTIMVLSIVVAYTLCWIPYWCVQLTIEFFREDPALDFEIFTVFSYIAYGAQSINSALNPFLYAFGTHSHRRRLLYWMRRLISMIGCPVRTAQQLVDATSSSGSIGKNRSRGIRQRNDIMAMRDMTGRRRRHVTYTPSLAGHLTSTGDRDHSSGFYSNGKQTTSSRKTTLTDTGKRNECGKDSDITCNCIGKYRKKGESELTGNDK